MLAHNENCENCACYISEAKKWLFLLSETISFFSKQESALDALSFFEHLSPQ